MEDKHEKNSRSTWQFAGSTIETKELDKYMVNEVIENEFVHILNDKNKIIDSQTKQTKWSW